MPTPTIKPSARIAARQQARPHQLSVRLRKLREVSWSITENITEMCDEVEETMQHVGTAVDADTFLLIQQQRGEIGAMRDLIKDAGSYMQEAADDDETYSESTYKARKLIEKMNEAIVQSLRSEGLLKSRVTNASIEHCKKGQP